ncbi:MAG TPA: hypothetical protein VF753_09735 [Terriglobales bacterium]
MKVNGAKVGLVVVLAVALAATGCSAEWISVALADLPVLTQMALNIGTVVSTLESGQQISAADAAAIQKISAQASADLNLLASLYNQYKAAPSATLLEQIQAAIADINQNLPALLQAAHIENAALSARIAAAVNLIVTTVDSFAQLIPQSSGAAAAQVSAQKTALPRAAELKKQWNEQICGASGDAGLDGAVGVCGVK